MAHTVSVTMIRLRIRGGQMMVMYGSAHVTHLIGLGHRLKFLLRLRIISVDVGMVLLC